MPTSDIVDFRARKLGIVILVALGTEQEVNEPLWLQVVDASSRVLRCNDNLVALALRFHRCANMAFEILRE